MALCPDCSGYLPEGCTCAFAESDSVGIIPSTTSASSISPYTKIDPNPDNLIEDATGLRTPPNPLALQKPCVSVGLTSSQTFTINEYRRITWNSTHYDTHGMWGGATGILAVRDGWHHFGVRLRMNPGTSGLEYLAGVVLNVERDIETGRKRWVADDSDAGYLQLFGIVPLEVNDALQLGVWVVYDIAAIAASIDQTSRMWVHWARPLE